MTFAAAGDISSSSKDPVLVSGLWYFAMCAQSDIYRTYLNGLTPDLSHAQIKELFWICKRNH